MNKPIIVVMLVTLFVCFGCKNKEEKTKSIKGIELSIDPGEHWKHKIKTKVLFIPISVTVTPQIAAWIEDKEGNYISTITVTNKSAKKNWRSSPKGGRPEALPVWNYKMENNSMDIDGISSASKKDGVDVLIENGSLLDGQEYNVYLEVNHSYDYNDAWPKKENDVNGQPSLIYHAQFTAGNSGRVQLTPIGYGSVDASDGNIAQSLNGITSALTIIKDANIIIN
jgi:hypothetical protein